MWIALGSALAFTWGLDFLYLQDFSTRDFTWLLIGAALGLVVAWAISRRRRRWF